MKRIPKNGNGVKPIAATGLDCSSKIYSKLKVMVPNHTSLFPELLSIKASYSYENINVKFEHAGR